MPPCADDVAEAHCLLVVGVCAVCMTKMTVTATATATAWRNTVLERQSAALSKFMKDLPQEGRSNLCNRPCFQDCWVASHWYHLSWQTKPGLQYITWLSGSCSFDMTNASSLGPSHLGASLHPQEWESLLWSENSSKGAVTGQKPSLAPCQKCACTYGKWLNKGRNFF